MHATASTASPFIAHDGERAPARPSLGIRARTALHRFDLDARLAAGADPAESFELAARADHLSSPRRRRAVARGLESVVAAVDRRRPGLSSSAPLNCDEITAARPLLLNLAARLRADAPAAPCGLARARRLLADPYSPLHVPTEPGAVAVAARSAIDGLDGPLR